MSQWRIVVRAMHAKPDAVITVPQLELQLGGEFSVGKALTTAQRLGLVACNNGRGPTARWKLTPLGIAFCEGKAQGYVPERADGYPDRRLRIAATWLAALPTGIRLQTKAPWADCAC